MSACCIAPAMHSHAAESSPQQSTRDVEWNMGFTLPLVAFHSCVVLQIRRSERTMTLHLQLAFSLSVALCLRVSVSFGSFRQSKCRRPTATCFGKFEHNYPISLKGTEHLGLIGRYIPTRTQ